MRKAVALLMILVMATTTLFAVPVSAVGSVDALSTEVVRVGLSTQTDTAAGLSIQTNIPDDADDLFGDVQATQLTTTKAAAVDFGTASFGGITLWRDSN
jgi:hypothetical protein